MPVYYYRAYNVSGKSYQSSIDCETLTDAKARLLELGIPFVSVKEGKKKRAQKISQQSLLLFTEQLSQLLQADIPLFDSLKLLKDQFKQDAFFPILDNLCEQLSNGVSFSDALAKHPQHFDLLYCTLAQMGEQSGNLDLALKRIAKEISKSCKIQKQLQSALLYPSILATFCCIVLGVLIYYIIPSIETLFESASMGGFTKAVMSMCHHIRHWGISYGIFLVATFLSFRSLLKIPKYKKKYDQFILSIPKIRDYIVSFELTRWTSTLALLLKGDVALLDALKLAQNLISNTLLKETFAHCSKKVSEGISLSVELKKYSFFSPLLVQVIAVGENSGDLAASFAKLSYLFEEDIDKKLSKFMTLLAPISLIIMAALIGLIMLAVLLPLTDINSLLN
ncbi:MAG: Type II secretion system protein F [Chlamydiae bacterium]|nr:Type II secretion system protein F [Chlamydiota bacterium]